MTALTRLAVYCGSAPGGDQLYADAARDTGEAMAIRGIDLVYGGGKLGLMGIVADAVIAGGGRTYGVIPEALVDLEVAHTGLTELHTVAGMHERKAKMTELADGFLVLPGGIGTLDELFEAWSWNALGYHAKPFCLVDIGGFWQGLTTFLDHVSSAGFISPNRRAQLLVAQSPAEAIERLDEAARNASQAMVW
ncbi:TIGR00730 family Rossman fold protein [Sphingomonas sp. RB1R13]|uniref:LOG family protein n=1 Tax=Sphingomonas sp. RB1R13 TaxID=3096159 RepID=UPI002FC78ED4